jgi:hypothetical protein
VSKHYETGTKEKVLAYMAECAIRDRAALIDAYTPQMGAPSEDAKHYIAECKANIRDFKKLAQHGFSTPPAQPAVPEGWKLVPVEPTEIMQDAGVVVMPTVDCHPYDAGMVYKAMLAATPTQGETK